MHFEIKDWEKIINLNYIHIWRNHYSSVENIVTFNLSIVGISYITIKQKMGLNFFSLWEGWKVAVCGRMGGTREKAISILILDQMDLIFVAILFHWPLLTEYSRPLRFQTCQLDPQCLPLSEIIETENKNASSSNLYRLRHIKYFLEMESITKIGKSGLQRIFIYLQLNPIWGGVWNLS